jgi:hypothetical protein
MSRKDLHQSLGVGDAIAQISAAKGLQDYSQANPEVASLPSSIWSNINHLLE